MRESVVRQRSGHGHLHRHWIGAGGRAGRRATETTKTATTATTYYSSRHDYLLWLGSAWWPMIQKSPTNSSELSQAIRDQHLAGRAASESVVTGCGVVVRCGVLCSIFNPGAGPVGVHSRKKISQAILLPIVSRSFGRIWSAVGNRRKAVFGVRRIAFHAPQVETSWRHP